jgi:hypothetical protein
LDAVTEGIDDWTKRIDVVHVFETASIVHVEIEGWLDGVEPEDEIDRENFGWFVPPYNELVHFLCIHRVTQLKQWIIQLMLLHFSHLKA